MRGDEWKSTTNTTYVYWRESMGDYLDGFPITLTIRCTSATDSYALTVEAATIKDAVFRIPKLPSMSDISVEVAVTGSEAENLLRLLQQVNS